MEQDTQHTPEEWITEDSIDTFCRIEELFLSFACKTDERLKGKQRARVNGKALAALRRWYKKYGRIYEPGPDNPELPRELIEGLIWALPKVQETNELVN